MATNAAVLDLIVSTEQMAAQSDPGPLCARRVAQVVHNSISPDAARWSSLTWAERDRLERFAHGIMVFSGANA